ncbi:E3 ubiquitin-protein ligase MARCH4 [Hypsizygus marmoreus]|uniref:E3 ubiquitin-protein ligase MARCH4 n=1 Tax=Hypsizygus marmoreus TaxID=39966 RepID=A0A369K715_HYPMA|nr:E3 ubiquitin-protein ligase MARCH4 [Hypsizygus marmoreus]
MPEETPTNPEEEKQCRICLDGVDAERELGRLIRPCLCKGSISYVHLKCLHTWRITSPSKSAFFSCPQCHYKYRFSRTRFAGIAANPVIVGGLSGLVFTSIVMLASFITTFFMSAFEEPTHAYYFSSYFYVSPFSLAQDLITAALRILRDEDAVGLFDDNLLPRMKSQVKAGSGAFIPAEPRQRGIFVRFIRRFILGLPMVGAGSLVHMLLTAPILGPLQWLARQRGGRRRREQSRDIAAMVILALLIVGAVRALYKVYQITESTTKRLLLRAEDAILEVN